MCKGTINPVFMRFQLKMREGKDSEVVEENNLLHFGSTAEGEDYQERNPVIKVEIEEFPKVDSIPRVDIGIRRKRHGFPVPQFS